jgi:hypothetical protein
MGLGVDQKFPGKMVPGKRQPSGRRFSEYAGIIVEPV